MSKIVEKLSFNRELQAVEQLYREKTGQELPKFYRPPQGVYSKESLEYTQELGYTTVFWSLAYADWQVDKQPTKAQAFAKLIPRLHNGAIILLHSTSATNAEILGDVIDQLRAEGYEFAAFNENFDSAEEA